MLERFLNSTQQKIVGYLLNHGERSLTEITEEVGLSKPTISRQLKELVDMGIVNERAEITDKGKIAVHSLKRFTLLLSFNPSAQSVLKIQTPSEFTLPLILLEQLREDEFKEDLRILLEAVQGLGKTNRPISIILFGSVAEEKATWKSDIDVAIIGLTWNKSSRNRMESLLSDVNMKTKHQVKPHFVEKLQFTGSESLLVNEIKNSGLVIYGDIFERSEIWGQLKRYKSISK